MKIMAGAFSLARANASLTSLAPSPINICKNYQPGYDGYQPAGYRGRIKKEPQYYIKYLPMMPRKGRDYNKPSYYDAANKGPRSYYEPISE